MTFRRRFVVLFLVVSIVPIALIQVYTFWVFVPSLSQKVGTLIEYNLQQKKNNIRLVLKQEVDVIYQIAGDPAMSESVRALVGSDAGQAALQESRVIETFSRLGLFHSALAGIAYLGPDGRFVEYDKYLMARDASEFNRFVPLSQIRDAVDQNGGLQFFPTVVFRDRANFPKNLFLITFPYVDVATRAKTGYLILVLHESALREILNPADADAAGFLTRSFLFDKQGRLYSAPHDASFAEPGTLTYSGAGDVPRLVSQLPELSNKPIKAIQIPGPFEGWTLVTLYDESSVLAERNLLAFSSLVLGLFFVLVSGTSIYWGFRNLFRSFTSLMEAVSRDDGVLDLTLPAHRNEFEVLGEAWSETRNRIAGLVSDVNSRNASLLAVSEDRRIAEIRALEAQVNPHFLFNTLNTLNWMAIRENQTQLSQALSDLGEIMRYSISQIDLVATWREERLWTEKYLSLQKLRFGSHVEYRITDEGVDGNFRLYKLLLQPLLENSFVHAFDPQRPGNFLEVILQSQPGRRLRMTVRDNGRGLAALPDKAPSKTAIGLSNVAARIKAYYGDRAEFSYQSHPGKGTEVTLEIPEADA